VGASYCAVAVPDVPGCSGAGAPARRSSANATTAAPRSRTAAFTAPGYRIRINQRALRKRGRLGERRRRPPRLLLAVVDFDERLMVSMFVESSDDVIPRNG
jgi:hypothetical protein